MGTLIPLFLTSGDFYPGFQSQWGLSPACNGFLRFIPAVKLADLLMKYLVWKVIYFVFN